MIVLTILHKLISFDDISMTVSKKFADNVFVEP